MKSVQPKNMKKYNERLLIEFLLSCSNATKAEISEKTGMSITTVRTQLQALMDKEAVCTMGEPESIGGRPAEKYALSSSYAPFLFIDFGFAKSTVIVQSLSGKKLVEQVLRTEQIEAVIIALLDQFSQIELIEIAVPGIPVEQGFLYGENLDEKKTYHFDFLSQVSETISVEVINDLNLCAFGQLQKYPAVEHLVYLSFGDCVGTGIIIDRKLYTGYQAFAGEIGLLNYEGHVIDEWLRTSDDNQREAVIRYVLELVSLLLSPQMIIVSECRLSEKAIEMVSEEVNKRIWSEQQIVLTKEAEGDRLSGAYRQAVNNFMEKGWTEA